MKKIIVLTLTFMLMTTPFALQLDAKEINYAPTNPTPEQVEAAASTDLVVFEDANLEQRVSVELGVPVGEITVADMESLISLSSNGFDEIYNITGLEYATNLTTLFMSGNYISDVSPLSGLINLAELDLGYNQISDISPLSGLINLTEVDLESNQISDISPLAGLINLTSLRLGSNQISDISPLSGLINLTDLRLSRNQISDISPLSGLNNLSVLYIHTNQISDISSLSGLINLTNIQLYDNQISDISPLTGLSNLISLKVNYNQITDISPLRELVNLRILDLGDNQISDISSLGSLANMTVLFVGGNPISDISVLGELTNLTDLSLYNLPNVVDFSPINNLENLVDLVISTSDPEQIHQFDNLDLLGGDDSIQAHLNSGSTSTWYSESANGFMDLEPITVTTPDPITYTITDRFGNELTSTSEPLSEGTNNLTWSFTGDYVTVGDGRYSFEINQEVVYDIPSELTANTTATTTEETALSDVELISLFNVVNNEDEMITVDQTAVDYSTPGEYQVIFTDESGNEVITSLEITDVLPVIEVTNEELTIMLGSTVTDYITDFGATATEITAGDLTTVITTDDSNVNYSVTGTYSVVFTVVDAEGNEVSKEVSLVIERDPTTEVDPITPEVDVVSNLTGSSSAATTEETILTDAELISLFTVTNDQDRVISVDQSAVDYSTPGEYQVVFTDTDSNEFIGILTVEDILPVIEVTNEELTIMLGSTVTDYITDFGVTATEITAGDLTTAITVDDSNVNYSVTGTYSVVFTVVDAEGNEVSKEVSLVIERDPTTEVDPITPEVDVVSNLTGSSSAATPEETSLTDAALISLFTVTNDQDRVISVDQSAVDYSTPGEYQVVFTDTDSNEFIGTLTVEDILPVIEVTNEELTIMLGSTVTDYIADFGATATEITAGDLTTAITVDDGNVNYSVTGTYPVVFTVVDAEGNEVSKEVSLVIERDPTTEVDPITPEVETNQEPVITADSAATTAEETELTDTELIALFAVTAEDEGVDISTSITVDQSAVDYSTPGTYTVVFTVEDEFGLQTVFEGQLTVEDILPTLIVSDSEVYITSDAIKEDLLELLDMSATEITSGDLTATITIDDSEVEYGTPGTYMLYISVADEEGNTALQQVSVIITADDVIVDPVDPTDPIDPVDPVDPTDPVDPIDPVDPTTDNNDDSNDDYVQMDKSEEENDNVLATTGSKSVIIFFIVSLVVFVGLKLSFKESKSAN